MNSYLDSDQKIFLFSGELEDFYTEKAEALCAGLTKEEKAICIASELVNGKEDELVKTTEIEDAFRNFSKTL
jgi:hypothetical protein